MVTQTEAKIYLGADRGIFSSPGYRSCRTFHFENYAHAGKESPGALRVFNDETLAPGASDTFSVSAPTEILLIPIAGGIEVHGVWEEISYVSSGESIRFNALPGNVYSVTNPYPDETVNYLQIRFVGTNAFEDNLHMGAFDTSIRNELLPLSTDINVKNPALVGIFDGRAEATYQLHDPKNKLFVFVIEGAFEVQNRLLERRDGLALWHLEEAEMEALSNNAVILLIEFQE